MEFLNWVQDNWFISLQSLGIVAGLFFTGIALLIDTKVRKVSNRFEATKQHREIWTLLFSRGDLKRVLADCAQSLRLRCSCLRVCASTKARRLPTGTLPASKAFCALLSIPLQSRTRTAPRPAFPLHSVPVTETSEPDESRLSPRTLRVSSFNSDMQLREVDRNLMSTTVHFPVTKCEGVRKKGHSTFKFQ